MSSREWVFRVQDILKAIEKVQRYTRKLTFTKSKQNELVIDAVVRNFEIIGEASKNIPPSIQHTHSEIPWKEMKGMRDILIHEYFGVDIKILWHASKNNLPSLHNQLKSLLQKVKDD